MTTISNSNNMPRADISTMWRRTVVAVVAAATFAAVNTRAVVAASHKKGHRMTSEVD